MEYVNVGIKKLAASKIATLDGVGMHAVDYRNTGSHDLVASYVRASDGRQLISDADAKVSSEDTYDGATLASIPIAPGSVSITATGIVSLKDVDKDGILYLDRTTGSSLAVGTDGVVSAAATKTLTSAGSSFITAGVVAGDKLVTVTSTDKCERTIVAVTATVLTVDSAWPVGGNTNVQFAVFASKVAAGSVNYFTGKLDLAYPTSPAIAFPVSKASVLGSVAFPIALSPGDTVTVDVDGVGADTATFDATRAEYPGNQGASLTASSSESLVVKVDGGASQTLIFGAGTENTAALYATKINSQLVNGNAVATSNSLNAMIGSLNEMLVDYTAHIASTVVHSVADAVNVLTEGPATNLATAILLANELKSVYNTHRSQAGVHVNNDAGNEITSADASDLATLVTLVAELKLDMNAHMAAASELDETVTLLNEMRTDYEAHRILVGGGEHVNADATNALTAPAATTLATAVTLANDIKAQLTAHQGFTSTLSEAITLVNEIKLDYNAHIADTDVHTIADAVNPTSAGAATDLASAIVLANEIKLDYNAHRSEAGVHVNNDAGNEITSADATDLATLTTLANELKTDISAHLVEVSSVEEAITLLNEIKLDYEAHRILTAGGVHGAADTTNTVSAADATDYATAVTLANELKVDYEAHRVLIAGGEHGAADATNTVSAPDATTVATLVALANDLRTQYEAHRVLVAGGEHGAADVTNVVTAVAVETASIHNIDDTTNTISSDAVNTAATHAEPDTVNGVAAANATNMATLLTLAIELRVDYNNHIASAVFHGAADVANATTSDVPGTAGIHIQDDTTNTITAMPDSLSIYSDTYGTNSSIQVVSGTGTILAKLGMATGTYSGTGDVGDITAVTFSEFKTVMEADIADIVVTQQGSYAKIINSSASAGAASTLQVAGTARAKLGFSALAHDGTEVDAEQEVEASYVQSTVVSAGHSALHRIAGNSSGVEVYMAAKDGPSSVKMRSYLQEG